MPRVEAKKGLKFMRNQPTGLTNPPNFPKYRSPRSSGLAGESRDSHSDDDTGSEGGPPHEQRHC